MCTDPETHSVEEAIEGYRTICLDKNAANITIEREKKEKSTQKTRTKYKFPELEIFDTNPETHSVEIDMLRQKGPISR